MIINLFNVVLYKMLVKLLEEDRIKFKRFFGVYFNQASFIVLAIEPALEVKPWLYDIVDNVLFISLVLSTIILIKLCDNYKELLLAEYDSRSNWFVWLFISSVGIMVRFAYNNLDIIAWAIMAIFDIICIFLPEDKLLKRKLNRM